MARVPGRARRLRVAPGAVVVAILGAGTGCAAGYGFGVGVRSDTNGEVAAVLSAQGSFGIAFEDDSGLVEVLRADVAPPGLGGAGRRDRLPAGARGSLRRPARFARTPGGIREAGPPCALTRCGGGVDSGADGRRGIVLNYDALWNFLESRRSVRRFLPDPVADEDLARVLEAARLAPSAGNLQAYRIVVVRDERKRSDLAGAALDQQWIREAPVVLGFVACGEESGRTYGRRGRAMVRRAKAGFQTMPSVLSF